MPAPIPSSTDAATTAAPTTPIEVSNVGVPAWLTSTPATVVLWIATTLVLASIIYLIMRGRTRTKSSSELLVDVVAHSMQLILFAVGVVGLLWGLEVLGGLDNQLIARSAETVSVVLYASAIYVLGLFLARQFLAPPWWRLNAWDGHRRNDRFGVVAAVEWIRDDIRELMDSMRLIDRLVVFGAGPLTFINMMIIFGARDALITSFAALFVCYLALVVALFTANRIPRVLLTRLQDLRAVARRIASGDLSARVGYTDTGEYEELGELVGDINTMARSLQSREYENDALNTQLNQALQFEQERASRDPLTQLRNHRYFQEALAAELYRCSRTGELTTIAIIDLDDFKAVNDTYGHQEGDAVLVRTSQALVNTLRPYDLPARLGGEEFGVIFPSTTPEEAKVVMDRIMQVLETAGPNSTVQTFSGGIATFPLHATDQSTLCQLADSSSYAAKMNGKRHTVVFDPSRVANVDEDNRVNTRERDAQLKAARTLVQTVDMLEGMGNEHSETVGRISAQLAGSLGYDDSFQQQMYLCGLLHDVGKLGLEQSLVQKAGKLTPEEFEQVKRHPDLSAQIVINAGLGDIAAWVRHHHEHFDGTGYPVGLAGHDIPIGSRIVLVAEAWDVMTTDRAYRRAMSAKDACDELLRGAGGRFDPDVVAHLVDLVNRGEIRPGGGAAPGSTGWNRAA